MFKFVPGEKEAGQEVLLIKMNYNYCSEICVCDVAVRTLQKLNIKHELNELNSESKSCFL